MRRIVSFALLAVPLFCASGAALAQKAKDKTKDKPDDGEDRPKWVKVTTITGRVAAVYEEKRRLRITVAYAVTTLDAGAAQQMAQAQRDLAMAAAKRDAQGILNARNSLVQAQARLYKTESKTADVEVQAIDDVVVRTARIKEDFDEKGKIKKKHTKEELKELKGDPKLPGYKAEWGDLQTDQIVTATIVRKKGEPVAKPVRPKKGKKGEETPLDAIGTDTPQVGMINIIQQPPPGK
ncbi:MAG: hypothetical protein K2W96_13855 [Gemmataceae bacterium]|nr:hypothetical protein [Gemmataceae bacterium]